MFKNRKGDMAIVLSLGVSAAILGYMGILQIIASNRLKININNLLSMDSYLSNEVYAWHGYMKKKADEKLVSQGGTASPVAESSKATGRSVASIVDGSKFCGTSPSGVSLCIKAKSGSASGLGTGSDGSGVGSGTDGVGNWRALEGLPSTPMGTFGCLVWTGSKVISWGGYTKTGYINTGAVYEPVMGTWEATGVGANVPSHRSQPACAWTGSKLLVWGGNNPYGSGFDSYRKDGAQYDPVTKVWTPISPIPNTNDFYSIVQGYTEGYTGTRTIWTGTHMILFKYGAHPGSSPGAMYNPATDKWTAISEPPNMPYSIAIEGTYIWTGKEVIVWGGYEYTNGQFTLSQYGAKFDPAKNSWTLMSKGPNAPEARQRYSAVWTGKNMIVWGGSRMSFSDMVPGGSIYDPDTDTWKAMSTINEPKGRINHVSVWTGSQMIVWGGNGKYSLDAGGIYDPKSDSWKPTAIDAKTPSPRSYPAAVWVGNKMLVFGGDGLNEGGIFDPAATPSTEKKATPVITLSEKNLQPGQYFLAHFSNINTPKLATYAVGADMKNPIQEGISGAKEGDLAFVAPLAPGEYELRVFANYGVDGLPPDVTIPFHVAGVKIACGVGTPEKLQPAQLQNAGYGLETHSVIGPTDKPSQKMLPQALVNTAFQQQTAASDLKMGQCTGDTSELYIDNPQQSIVDSHHLTLNTYFGPRTAGSKRLSCEFSYCDGFKVQHVSFVLSAWAQ